LTRGGRVLLVPVVTAMVAVTVYASAPGAASERVAPVRVAAGTGAPVTPSEERVTQQARRTWPRSATPTTKVNCPKGSHQREVERYLRQLGTFGPIVVDGKQTNADCKTIKKFQVRYGIWPTNGYAGVTTRDAVRRIATTNIGACKTGAGTTFCVDLTHQTVFAMRGGKVILGPTIARTGMAGGFQTPAGTYAVRNRNLREWSDPYEVWLPYWQRFNGGMGFHETTTYIYNSFGSHGCINLLHADAVRLWQLGTVGTRVYIFGRRPGT